MPQIKAQFFDSNGNPASAGKVYTWQTGTNNTAKATYTDSTGTVENANPVTLDSNGRAAIWLDGYYHIQAYDAAGNLIADTDNVSSLPFTSAGTSQWVDQNLTFTYVDGTHFSVPGVYTDTFEAGARVKAVVTAGTIYGAVVSSTSGGSPVITTVTMTWDSGTLDDGLSTISVGIITPSNSAQIGATYADLVKLHGITESAALVNAAADLLDPANRVIGDILTETAAGTMGAIAAAAAGNYLKSAGVATLPAWGKLALRDTGVKFGIASISTSGNTVITGVGFTPSVVLLVAIDSLSSASMSFGVDNGTTHSNVALYGDGSTSHQASTLSIDIYKSTATMSGYVSTVGADGFTIAATVSGTIEVHVLYLALP
jgi:hypothetical protein